MEALTLARPDVLRSADVANARERARQRRLRHLALLLALVAVPLAARAVLGGLRYARGDLSGAASAFRWPLPHLPAGAGTYAPSVVLILVLVVILAVPLLGAGRSPHVLYRPEEIGVRLSDVKGAGVVVEEVVKTLNLFLAYQTFKERMGGTPAASRPFRGSPGNRQDLPGQGHGCRSRGALPLRVLLGLPVDVLRPDQPEDPVLFQGPAGSRPARGRRDRLHRGDRRHRRYPRRARSRRWTARGSPA